MAENKTKATGDNVTAFLAGIADPERSADARVLADLMQRISGEPPYMYGPSIIGFGSVHYRYDSGREGDMPAIAFSPRAKEQVLYVLGFPGQEEFLARLGNHRLGKSCLYLKRLSGIDMAVLEALVTASFAHAASGPVQSGC